MTCTNLFSNLEIKEATYNILSNIHNFTRDDKYKPDSINIFSDALKEELKTYYINTDLYNIDNNNKENLVVIDNDNENGNNNVYVNCVYQSSLPWYTTSENKKKCEVIKNIKLPENRLLLDEKSLTIKPIFKSSDKTKSGFCSHKINVNRAYCENRWYDWIIVPNFYLGNTYYKDNSQYTEADVYKCYAPCKGDYMPYTKPNGELKCIPKKYFGNGIFSNKYIYCAFGLINLIGNIALITKKEDLIDIEKNNKQTDLLYILHSLLIEYHTKNNVDNDLYKIDVNLKNTYLYDTNKYDDIYNEFENSIKTNIFFKFSTSENQDYSNTNEFTYKHRNFNEDDTEMYSFNGLDVNNILIDPILIHTWMIANLFKPLDDKIFNNGILNGKITNKNQAHITLLHEKLWRIFNDEDKVFRLKNIFFKAVNICYNNKTNFSTNIIEKTKTAFNNKNIIDYIIQNKFYNFKSNIWFFYYLCKFNDNNHPSNYPFDINGEYDKYKNCITKILSNDTLDEFIEYKLYKDTETDELQKKYNIFFGSVGQDAKWKYKYFYSMERLEKPTCPKGYEWNSKYKFCDLIKQSTETTEIKEDESKDEDDFQIPELNNILYLFFKIILIIIILYIIYVFYDIFSEVIIKIINNIYGYISLLIMTINNKFKYNNEDIDDKIAELKDTKKYYESKYKRIEDKDLIISDYINTHKKPTIT
jgi:hypothetical protein